MSVLIKILKMTIESMPEKGIELRVRTMDEEIRSNIVPSSCIPSLQLAFMVPYIIKKITFQIRDGSNDEEGRIVGKADYYLYNVRQIRQGEKGVKMITLHNENKGKQLINSDIASLAGTLVFQISHNSKRRILAQIERVYFNIEEAKKNMIEEQQMKVAEHRYEEIFNVTTKQPLQNGKEVGKKGCEDEMVKVYKQKKDESCVYEVDQQGYITLKPTKPQQKLEQIIEQINQASIIKKQQEEQPKIPRSLLSEIKDISEIRAQKPTKKTILHSSPSPPPQNAQKKLQIFQALPDLQPAHININPSSNMFQVYTMCCGEQIDFSHQVQSPPF